MKKILSLVVMVALISVANAQDIHFSQFFASPMTLNPALTGKFDGIFRVSGNYRNQWPTINNAYDTKTAAVDFGVMKNRISEIDQMGVGILGFTDRAGDGVLVTNTGMVSISYHKGLDENGYHSIGAGFQVGYTSKRLDVTKVYFEDELTPFGFVPGTTGEVFTNKQINVNYVDVNAGLLYNGSTNGYNNFYLGASMYHINRPKESFQGGQFLLPARVTLQGGFKLPVASYHSVHFSAIHSMQAKSESTVLGAAFCYNVNHTEDEPTNVYIGSWMRFGTNSDAVIPYIGLEFRSLHIGYSYDVTVSSLNSQPNSPQVGGNEISLIFIKKKGDPDAKKLNCPKF